MEKMKSGGGEFLKETKRTARKENLKFTPRILKSSLKIELTYRFLKRLQRLTKLERKQIGETLI